MPPLAAIASAFSLASNARQPSAKHLLSTRRGLSEDRGTPGARVHRSRDCRVSGKPIGLGSMKLAAAIASAFSLAENARQPSAKHLV